MKQASELGSTTMNDGTLRSRQVARCRTSIPLRAAIAAVALSLVLAAPRRAPAKEPPPEQHAIDVSESSEIIHIETDALSADVRKQGYVSGIAAGTFVDRKTGAHDLGFGLHIQDWLMAPGWRDDGYERTRLVHGNLPKHIVEGPQLCTQAKKLPVQVIRGKDFVALQLRYTYPTAGKGYQAGSRWEQTLVFQPHVRYVLSAERITSANDVDDLFYRLDMPGHIKHHGPDTFEQVYLSYRDKPIPADAFNEDFAPDEKFFYQRGKNPIPQRMIRAYQVKLNGKPGPWLAGMTLDPSEVAEAWCHQRGYVCFIEELHRRHVKKGESFGAAYVIGWFDDVHQMQATYDRYKGATRIVINNGHFRLER